MKKLFTILAVCAATIVAHTASAGVPLHAGKSTSQQTIPQTIGTGSSVLRSATCDTLINEVSPTDTPEIYLSDTPNVGFFSGSGALDIGGTFAPVTGIAENLSAPAVGMHVTAAAVIFGSPVIKSSDSGTVVKAYVYDTTGTSIAFNEYTPGNALDSATVTLREIAYNFGGTTLFTFTNQPNLPSRGFFVAVSLPQITGDSLEVATNQGTSGDGQAYIELNYSGQTVWASYDSLTGGTHIGSYIIAVVCGSNCPNIAVSATQIGTSSSAYATASGGVAPYTYHWNNNETKDTATGLGSGTYTVTVTDHNGCTGTATVSVSTGINSIGDIRNFSVFPNPSTGAFTASVHLAATSDVVTTVTDITGKVLLESTDSNIKDLNKVINLGNVSTGIYFVNIKTAEGSANQRIVIQ